MGTQLWTWTVWFFLLYGTSTTVTGSCKQECPSSSTSVFHYQDGHKYTYNLEGTSVTTLPETQGDVSKQQLKATVEVHVQSACSHLIKLKGVQVIGSNGKKYGSLKNIEANPVIANFQRGIINNQLCADSGDSQEALNIKRAVLSLLQVSASSGSVREVDVFGICPTEISSSKSGDIVTVKKVRNLNKCSNREYLKQEILSTPFVGKADFHSMPLLESTYSSEQQIKNGIVSSAVSHESYLFRPFSRQGSGAKTTVETKLILVSEKGQAISPPASINAQRSIIFEALHQRPSISNKQSILDALHAAGDSMQVSVGTDSASKFRVLVDILRDSSKEDILSVYGQVKAGAGFSNKHAARKVLLDAIFRAGTGDSVVAAVELLKSHEITGEQAKLWYASIGFARHASASSLAAVSALLDDAPSLPREAILAIGSLAGHYCREHNCEHVPQLNDLLGKFGKLIKLKVKSIQEENNVIIALKALANIHYLNNAVAERIKQVASEKSLPARVRVAALETYQSYACQSALTKSALEILRNPLEDSEVRIKAYLALVECPSGAVANSLQELLEKEPTNQVGSFIVSHLRNLRASANPSKALAKQHLGQLKPRKRFPQDFRKFSSNSELSYILDGLNIGNSLEYNVIYSQNSYVPRSVSLNLTTEIFGHSYNVLQLSSRTENAEKILESYLGPNGFLKQHNWLDVIDIITGKIQATVNAILSKVDETFRHKRSISQGDLERIKNEVIKSLPPSHEGDSLILDLSLKIFGSELAWINIDEKELSAEHIVDKIISILQGAVQKAENFNHEIRNHVTFLDTELTYPTGLGFPLKLAASGSSAVHLKFSGKIDIPELIKSSKISNFQLDVRPSAAIEIIGALTVGSPSEESGLKVAYTLHTDTGLNVAVKAVNGKVIDVNVGLPVKKQDLLTVKTDVLSTVHELGHKEIDTPLVFNVNRKEHDGCFDQASPLIGLTLCTSFGFPYDLKSQSAALFPLNGPSILSLKLESDDVSSYHFKGLLHDEDPNHRSVEILFDTPGSKTSRKLEAILSLDLKPNKEAKISLKSPWKTLALEGKVIDSNEEQSLSVKFLNDEKAEYSFKVGARVGGSSDHRTYSPLLQYKVPDQKGYQSAKGTKTARISQDYNVRGSVTVDKEDGGRTLTFNKVSLRGPQGDIEIDGTVVRKIHIFSTDVKVSYGSQHIILKSKLQKIGEHHYKVGAGIVPSKQQDLGIGLSWEYEYKPNELRNELIVVHGSDLKSESNRITVNQQLRFKYDGLHDFEFLTKNSLTYPLLNIDARFEGNAKPKSINYDLHIGYETNVISSELHAKTEIKKPGDYDVVFKAEALKTGVALHTSRDIIGPDRSKFINVLELPCGKYDLSADVTHKYHRNNVNLQLVALLKIDDNPKSYELDTGLILKPELLNSHTKLKVGPDTVVDSLVLINEEPSRPNGNIKIFIKDYIDGTSTFNFHKGAGQAVLNIDLPKINRKIRGNANLKVTGTVHEGKLDLYWNADNDPNQKLSIQTTSDIKQDSIDSKNIIYILDYKTVLNIKGALTGRLNDGYLIGNGDLILPNGRQFTVKYDETLHIRPTNSEGRVEIVLIDIPKKGSEPRRLSIEAAAKDVDPKRLSFEGSGKLEYTCPQGKNVKFTGHAKNIPQGQKNIIGAEGVVEGSLIPGPLRAKVDAEVSKAVITYKGSGSYGSDSSVAVAGSIRTGLGESSPQQFDNTIEIKLPSESLKHLKLSTGGSFSESEHQVEVKTNNVLEWNNANTLKFDGELAASGIEKVSGKVTITLPKEKPQSLAFTWTEPKDSQGSIKKAGSLALHWDGDKDIKLAGNVEIPQDRKSYKLKLTTTTTSEKLRKIDLTLSSKESESPARHIETEGILLFNDQTITLNSKIGLAPGVPLIDASVGHPKGTSLIYLNVDKFTLDEVKLQSKLQWILFGGGSLTLDGEAKLSVNDFKLVWNVDSPKLKIDKWHVEAGHRANKGNQRIIFSVSSNDKILLSGSTTLRTKTDGNSVKFDGTGMVKIGDQTQHLNFRIERLKLQQDGDGETGIQYVGKVNAGPRELEGLLKITDKEFHYLNKYCTRGEDCAHVEALSKLHVSDITEVKHEAIFTVDLKALDIPYGVDLKSKTDRKEWDIDHGFSIQLHSKEHETKYNYKVVVGKKNSAVTITLPHRVIALEVNTDIDVDGKEGHTKINFKIWWDKARKQASHASGSIGHNYKIDNNGITVSGEARFNNPLLEKELIISGRTRLQKEGKVIDSSLDLDIFKKENQKFTVLFQVDYDHDKKERTLLKLEVKSKGQNVEIVIAEDASISQSNIFYLLTLNYKIGKQQRKEALIKLDGKFDSLKALVKLPNTEVLNFAGSVKKSNDLPTVDAELSVIGIETLVLHSAVQKKGLLTFSSNIYKKNSPNNKVSLTSGIDNGVRIYAEHIKEGDKRSLFHLTISTKDEDFLKTDFGWATENIRKLFDEVRGDLSKTLQRLKKVLNDFATQLNDDFLALLDILRKNQPNIKRLLEVGQQQLKLIRNEIENDAVLHEISEHLHKIFGEVADIIEESVKGISNTIDTLVKAILEVYSTLIDSLTSITPTITEAWKKVVDSTVDLAAEISKEISDIISEIAKFVQAHEEEVKRYLTLVASFTQEIGKIFSKGIIQIIDEVADFSKLVIDELKSQEMYILLKDGYTQLLNEVSNLHIPEHFWISLQEILSYIKEGLPTEELQELVSHIEEYVEKIIKNKEVDYSDEIEETFEKLVKAIKSLFTILQAYILEQEEDLQIPGYKAPFSADTILGLSDLFAIRLSPLAYILSGDLPSLSELWYTYRPTLDPLDWIPPYRAYGLLVDANNFITFDHRHYKLKGSCSYILAQDYKGNFSIVANLGGGKLQSIGITDGIDSIEILTDRSLKVNDAVSEYPAIQGQFVAWRSYDRVGLKAKSGVLIKCHIHSDLCYFEVSGFYFARTNGLLGTINYEPWDDFKKPNGHVASKASEFVNEWKLNAACPDIAEEATYDDKPVSECNAIFSGSSSLSSCYPFVDPSSFRDACSDAVTNNQDQGKRKEIACHYAAAYVEVCRQYIPIISIPASCVECTAIEGKAFAVGETLTLKVPQRSADIVVLVEQTLDNAEIFKELVTSLVPTLTNDLKAKGINDVKFFLIGYGAPGQEWLNHYTSGGELGFSGKNIKFPEREEVANITVHNFRDSLQWLKQQLDGVEQEIHKMDAFTEVLEYPFRVGAVKTIVSVIATPCGKSNYFTDITSTIAAKASNAQGISSHLIAPIEDLHVDGKEEKQMKQLVGFDTDATYSLNDAKRRTLEGDHELRKNLEYAPTYCTEGAQKFNGAVFNSDNFLNAKQAQRKQFLQVVSHRIADSLTSTELTEGCTCLLLHGVHPRPVCRVVNRREKEHTKVKGVKG